MGFKAHPNTLAGYPGFPRAVGLGTAGDRWGATAVRGPGETVEKETADQPPSPERRSTEPIR
jgi:hypothetical protein